MRHLYLSLWVLVISSVMSLPALRAQETVAQRSFIIQAELDPQVPVANTILTQDEFLWCFEYARERISQLSHAESDWQIQADIDTHYPNASFEKKVQLSKTVLQLIVSHLAEITKTVMLSFDDGNVPYEQLDDLIKNRQSLVKAYYASKGNQYDPSGQARYMELITVSESLVDDIQLNHDKFIASLVSLQESIARIK